MDHTMDNTFESANRVYDVNGVAPTMNTCGGGGLQPKILEIKKLEQCICAMRGRNPENPSDRTPGIDLEQRLEVNSEGICNTLTSIQKDNLILEQKTIKIRQATKEGIIPSVLEEWTWEIGGEVYLIRIRKLIPKECWKLMGFTEEDFAKAKEVNSDTQLYKQAGNSIVKQVLMAIFGQIIERSEA